MGEFKNLNDKLMEFLKNLDFEIIKSDSFKEDSVREEILAPLLKCLDFSAFGKNKIIRSQILKHPYIYFGTKKENINIIPDYLLQVEGINKVIIDAKSPKENILSGKNPEQAFSYAIHKEIRAEIYALCNGLEFVVFNVNEIEPIFYSKIEELETNWGEFYRIMSPLGLTKPYVFGYKPDFGIRLLKTGAKLGDKQYFLGIWLNTIAKLDEDNYSFSCGVPFGEDCIGTFDFNKSLLENFLKQIPEDKRKKTKNALSHAPFKEIYNTQEESYEVAFECELSTKIIEMEHDIFCPLIIKEFITI